MRVIYQKIHHVRYLYIKRNVEKVWGARYTLGACYLSKNTVYFFCNATNFVTDQQVQTDISIQFVKRNTFKQPHYSYSAKA